MIQRNALSMLAKGYRSNPVLDAVTPDGRRNKKMFWSLRDMGPDTLMGGAAGGAKVVYDDGVVLTPFGFRKGSTLEVGTRVNNPDGTTARIIQLHPRQLFQVWRVHFHDGTFTDVGREHLWNVWRSGKRRKQPGGECGYGEEYAEVIETQELKSWTDKALLQEAAGIRPNWPCIPVCQEQVFNYKSPKSFVDVNPYLLGYWLGDGHWSGYQIGFTSADAEHAEQLMRRVGIDYARHGDYGYNFKGSGASKFKQDLKKLGLENRVAYQKFVPKQFLYASTEVRYAVLQGLMDTDGTVDERGQCYFSSTSQQLTQDVAHLVRSLGGTATVSKPVPGGYRDKNGNKVVCRDTQKVYIKHRTEQFLFRLARKRERVTADPGNLYRRVVKVEVLKERKYGRCITVSHPNGLYLTNDFIVTHNSHTLLSMALQYVDIPGYAALLIRAQYKDLTMNGGLQQKAEALLTGIPGAKKHDGGSKWTFETSNPKRPAVLQFGHLSYAGAEFNYKSSEFQFVGVDEATEIDKGPCLYLRTRIRQPSCPVHGSHPRPGCRECDELGSLMTVPLRFRLATNPGGKFGEWVKERYVPPEYIASNEETQFGQEWDVVNDCEDCEKTGFVTDPKGNKKRCPFCSGKTQIKRHFIPARLQDNPYINAESYQQSLKGADNPVEYMRLAHGRWDVMAQGNLFHSEWFRYYDWQGTMPRLKKPGQSVLLDPAELEWFVTADTASKDKTQNDWTVFIVWAMSIKSWDLLMVDMFRKKILIPDILPNLLNFIAPYPVRYAIIEEASSGIAVIQEARTERGRGLTVDPYLPGTTDKVSRSTEAQIRMKAGQIYFPTMGYPGLGKSTGWLSDAITELLGFNALEHDDIVDNFSMAARRVSHNIRSRSYAVGSPVPVTQGLYGAVPPPLAGPTGQGMIPSPSMQYQQFLNSWRS